MQNVVNFSMVAVGCSLRGAVRGAVLMCSACGLAGRCPPRACCKPPGGPLGQSGSGSCSDTIGWSYRCTSHPADVVDVSNLKSAGNSKMD